MTAAEREERILSLGAQVRLLAMRRCQAIHWTVNLDELISAGWLGAIKAVDTHDPALGCQLNTFAEWKIRGAILDYLRSLDPLDRGHRRLVRGGLVPDISTISADGHKGSHVADPRAVRDRAALEARLDLATLYDRAGLKARKASILRRRMAGETLREIAPSFRLHTSRVSQLWLAGIAQLRSAAA